MGRYEVLEEIALADCALAIEGESLDDLFQTAAGALADIMVDPGTLPGGVVRSVTLKESRLDRLFMDWLSELIYLKDRYREVFPRTRVRIEGAGPWHLRARLDGGGIDTARTVLRADPKAVTLHRFLLERTPGGWQARVVIDI